MNKGRLFLIPTLLSDEPAEKVLPESTLSTIRLLSHFIVEEPRTARRFLRKAGMLRDFEEISFHILNEHTRAEEITAFLDKTEQGEDTGLLSEAGTPCIADPGASIVSLAHRRGIRVIPLHGPSSILLALMASGFNGQNFAFTGYVPIDKILRAKRLKELEKIVYDRDQTQIFIETPYRNLPLFEAILENCRADTLLCIAAGLTGPDESIQVMTIREWKQRPPDIHKKPAVFLLYH
jgi:16S rRNA (cytidine1402-2'-O)-methyltransferase